MPDPLVDSHLHLWDPSRLRYPWLDGVPLLSRPYLLPDIDAASAGCDVQQQVFVQCDCIPSQSLEEAHWVSALAQGAPRLAAIIAHAPVELGEAVRPHLEALAGVPLVKGVRRLFQGEKDPTFCARPLVVAGITELGRQGMSFDLCVRSDQLPAATALVRACPGTSFILDHCAKPDIRARAMEPWGTQIRALAALPNVACKISGLVTETNAAGWVASDIQPYIDHVLDCFTPQRLMFGGDWPVVLQASTFSRWAETFRLAIAGLTADERRQISSQTARRVYRLA
jgi:L-fuconolactonase